MRELAELYFLFFRIGAVTFGGGLAMLSLLQHEIIEKRHWVTEEEMTDFYAISQCTPGVIAVNVSTMVGAKRKGILGGIIATLGFATMPLVSVIVISLALNGVMNAPIAQRALSGVQAFVCVIILSAIRKFWKGAIQDRFSVRIFALILCGKALCSLLGIALNSVFFILAAAGIGLVTVTKPGSERV